MKYKLDKLFLTPARRMSSVMTTDVRQKRSGRKKLRPIGRFEAYFAIVERREGAD